MPIIQPTIEVPDDIYTDYLAGNVDICGLAKNSDNGRIVKHLDRIEEGEDSDTDSLVPALIGVCIVAITGLTIHLFNKASQRKVEYFKKSLNEYINAVNEQSLTVELLDELISSLDKLKKSTRKKINIQFSTGELAALINCLCNHTKCMAEVNSIEIDNKYTDEENADILLKLRKNLVIQKELFEQAA